MATSRMTSKTRPQRCCGRTFGSGSRKTIEYRNGVALHRNITVSPISPVIHNSLFIIHLFCVVINLRAASVPENFDNPFFVPLTKEGEFDLRDRVSLPASRRGRDSFQYMQAGLTSRQGYRRLRYVGCRYVSFRLRWMFPPEQQRTRRCRP